MRGDSIQVHRLKHLVKFYVHSFERFQIGKLGLDRLAVPLWGPNRICFQIGLAGTIRISFCVCRLGVGYLGEGIKYSTFLCNLFLNVLFKIF